MSLVRALRLLAALGAVALGAQAILAATSPASPVVPAGAAANVATVEAEPRPSPTTRATSTPNPIVARSLLPGQVPTPAPRATRASGSPRQVFIIDFGYDPSEVRVKVGERVTWTQEGSEDHDVAFYDAQPTGSGALTSGQSYTRSFSQPGRYMYMCTFHPEMRGMVLVEP